jgi:hypothetical protein
VPHDEPGDDVPEISTLLYYQDGPFLDPLRGVDPRLPIMTPLTPPAPHPPAVRAVYVRAQVL